MQNLIIFALAFVVFVESIALFALIAFKRTQKSITEEENPFESFISLDKYDQHTYTFYKVGFYKNLMHIAETKKKFQEKSKEFGFEDEKKFIEYILESPK